MQKLAIILNVCALSISSLAMSQNVAMNQNMMQTQEAPRYESSYESQSINWLQNYAEAVSLSKSTSKPILILFTGSSWCPACIKLEREVISHPEFVRALNQRFVFLKANFPDYSANAMAQSPYKSLMDRYNVDSFPSLIIINGDGQQLFRINYRQGGPREYVQELLQKLNQSGR